MFVHTCHFLDRLAIWSGCASMRSAESQIPDWQPCLPSLGSTEFFRPAVGVPQVRFVGRRSFRLDSPVRTPWAENNQVLGCLFRAGCDWQRRPVVVLLHGLNGEWGYTLKFPYLAWRFRRRGISVVTMQLPFHGERRPRQPGALRHYLAPDWRQMTEAVRQSLADVRAVLAWLGAEGVPAVGMWGVSLGAWLTGLTACHSADLPLSAAVLMSPVVRMDLAVERLPFFARVREGWGAAMSHARFFNLEAYRPALARERLLVVAGVHDLFNPPETLETLCERWDQPQRWSLPHGHVSLMLSPRVLERTTEWVAARLNA